MTEVPQTLEIIIPGNPTPWGRAGKAGKHHYTKPAMAASQRLIAWNTIQQVGQRSLAGPLAVSLVFGMAIPASWSQKRTQAALDGTTLPTGRPDVDNLAKQVLDALNGVLWLDDAQVVDLHERKIYSANPSTLIQVRTLA